MSFPRDAMQPIPITTAAMQEGVDRGDDVRRTVVNTRMQVRAAINLLRSQIASDGTINTPVGLTGGDITTWQTAISVALSGLSTLDSGLATLETVG